MAVRDSDYVDARAIRGDFEAEIVAPALILSVLVGAPTFMIAQILDLALAIQMLGVLVSVVPLCCLPFSGYSHSAQMWVLVLGYQAIALLAALWLPSNAAAACLLVVPTALASLFRGRTEGLMISFVNSLFLLLAAPVWGRVPVVALLLIWIVQATIWGVLHFAWQMVEISQRSYAHTRTLLEEARSQRLQMKQMQEDLMTSNVELARLTDRLAAMRHEAEDARHVKEKFVANVSHELRTPLNMITGFSEMIVESPQTYGDNVPPALLADLNVVLRNSRHLSALIDDILDLSQIEAGRWALTKERVSMVELAQEAVTAVRPLYDSKGLYLRTEFREGIPRAFCDRTRVREVLLNLLSNAGRLTQEGGVYVRVSKQNHNVVVEVEDTGPGISLERQAKLFQPFERLDGSVRRQHEGSGLGLSISKAFVELHGGKMWLESEVDRGTSFFFRLPIDPPAALQDGLSRWVNPYAAREARDRRSAAPPPEVGRRFVVVEREGFLERLVRRYMSRAEAVRVETLTEAMEELSRIPAQALLVNDQSAGDDLFDMMQSGMLPYGTPAIVCTLPRIQDMRIASGAAEYLVKPISKEDLLGSLDRLGIEEGTILIVDDEPEVLQLFQRILLGAGRGYRVLRAEDGEQAIRLLRENRPDVMLLDLVMPEMDGFRVLELLEQDKEYASMPVVIISARDPDGQPIVGHSVSLVRGGGLSINQVLDSVEALTTIAGPGQTAGPAPK